MSSVLQSLGLSDEDEVLFERILKVDQTIAVEAKVMVGMPTKELVAGVLEGVPVVAEVLDSGSTSSGGRERIPKKNNHPRINDHPKSRPSDLKDSETRETLAVQREEQDIARVQQEIHRTIHEDSMASIKRRGQITKLIVQEKHPDPNFMVGYSITAIKTSGRIGA